MSDDPTAVTRRAMLRWLGGGTLAALGVRAQLAASAEAGEANGDADGLVAAALARVGRRYLEVTPEERDVATLRARLGELSAPPDVLAHVAALEQAVRRDFERGDILALDGWILSRTELRAAALVALTSPAAP